MRIQRDLGTEEERKKTHHYFPQYLEQLETGEELKKEKENLIDLKQFEAEKFLKHTTYNASEKINIYIQFLIVEMFDIDVKLLMCILKNCIQDRCVICTMSFACL